MLKPARFGKVALHVGSALVLAAIFLGALLVGIAIHLPLPPSRRVATRALTQGISNGIRGRIEVERFDRLSLGGFVAHGVVIRDPEGAVVLSAPRVSARTNMLAIASSALLSSGPIEIRFAFVRADRVDVQLIEDKDGTLTLARTFLPPIRPPPTVPTVPSPPARPVVVDLPAIEIGSIAARGNVSALGPVDADAHALTGSVYVGPGEARIDTRPFPLVARQTLPAVLGATMDFHWRAPALFWTSFLASFGDVLLSGNAKLDGKYVDAVIDVPRTTSDPLLVFAPSLRPGEPVEARLEVHGALPQLDTVAKVQLARAVLDARGRVTVSPLAMDLNVSLRHLDLATIRPGLPETNLGLDAHVLVVAGEGKAAHAEINGTVPATVLLGVLVPETRVESVVDAAGVHGTAWLDEPGMPLEARFKVSPAGAVEVKASTTIPSMAAAPRLQRALEGRAVADLEATWVDGTLDAKLTADVTRAGRGPVVLGTGRVTARAWGEPSSLQVDAEVHGSQLSVGGVRWRDAAATLRGPVFSPRATIRLRDDLVPDVRAAAGLLLRKGGGARDISITIEESGESVVVKTAAVHLRGDEVDLGKVSVDGLGSPLEGTVRVGPKGFLIRLASERIELGRFGNVAMMSGPRLNGSASASIDLENHGSETNGCVAIDATNAGVDVVGGIDASIRARFAGTHVALESLASLGGTEAPQSVASNLSGCPPLRPVKTGGIAGASFSANVALAGTPTSPASWVDATGMARLTELYVDLDKLGRLAGALRAFSKSSQIPTAGGTIQGQLDIVRDAPDQLPLWSLSASTNSFSLDLGTQEVPRRIEGADLFAFASMAPSGKLTVSACVRDDGGSFDSEPCDANEQNVLATFGAVVDLDYPTLLRDSARWSSVLTQAKVDAKLTLQERPMLALTRPVPWLQNLPFEAAKGAAWVRFRGTVMEPRIDYLAQLLDASSKDPDWRVPGTFCALGSYDGARTGLYAEVLQRPSAIPEGITLDSLCRDPRWRSASAGATPVFQPVGNLSANVFVPWDELTRATSLAQVNWSADIAGALRDFDLSKVPLLEENGVQGRLSISGGIRNLGLNPEFGIQAQLDDLRVGPTARYDSGVFVLRTDENGMGGTLRLSSADENGKATERLKVALETRQVRWNDELLPQFSSDETVDMRFDANDFDAAVLGPLVTPTLSYIEGRLNGSVHAIWSPKEGESTLESADLTLSEGAFEVPLLGQEFTGTTARIRATRKDQLSVDNFVARALTGAVEGRATIDLENLLPRQIAASIAANKKNRIRITYEGIPVGTFEGTAYATIHLGESQNQALIELEKVSLELAETGLRDVMQTTPNPDIVIVPTLIATQQSQRPGAAGTWVAESPEAPRTRSSVPWYVRFVTRTPALVTRSDLSVTVATPDDSTQAPLLVYPDGSGKAHMDGYVQLLDGQISVVGKTFEFEPGEGRIIFDGDPGSPEVNLATRWDAPDGTRVMAEVTGPLKDPKITFRSVPAKSAAEIFAMILTGTSQSETAEPTAANTGDTSAAAGVGGGVASVGINRILQDVSPVSVSTRVDTSEAENVRPSIAVQVARNVTAETTVNTGALAPGQTQDVYMLTLDWRFLQAWSMRTTVGNKGSSVFDVVWRHRY